MSLVRLGISSLNIHIALKHSKKREGKDKGDKIIRSNKYK